MADVITAEEIANIMADEGIDPDPHVGKIERELASAIGRVKRLLGSVDLTPMTYSDSTEEAHVVSTYIKKIVPRRLYVDTFLGIRWYGEDVLDTAWVEDNRWREYPVYGPTTFFVSYTTTGVTDDDMTTINAALQHYVIRGVLTPPMVRYGVVTSHNTSEQTIQFSDDAGNYSIDSPNFLKFIRQIKGRHQ